MNFDLIGSMWVRLNELDGEWIIGGALEAHFVQVFAFGKVCKEGGFEPTWNRVCSGRSSVLLTAKFAVTNAACKILQKSHRG